MLSTQTLIGVMLARTKIRGRRRHDGRPADHGEGTPAAISEPRPDERAPHREAGAG